MGDMVFDNMAQSMTATANLHFVHHVPMDAYEEWREGYLFDALQNLRYGQSFCNRFSIVDNILYYERDQFRADNYIRTHYIQRP